MEELPLLIEGRREGRATMAHESPYTRLTAAVPFRLGLWCAWAEGERGRVRIGVLEPEGQTLSICRRLSRQALAPAGALQCVRVLPWEEREALWKSAAQPEVLFQGPWLRNRLRGLRGVLCRESGGRREVAVPYRVEEPFPLPALFCFARLQDIRGRAYWVFAFDVAEEPIF